MRNHFPIAVNLLLLVSFLPAAERPFVSDQFSDWLDASNWPQGMPGASDIALFTSTGRAATSVSTTVEVGGLRVENLGGFDKRLIGDGEIVLGSATQPGRIEVSTEPQRYSNRWGDNFAGLSVFVPTKLATTTDIVVDERNTVVLGNLDFNSQTIRKTGPGNLSILESHAPGGTANLVLDEGGFYVATTTTFPGSLRSTNGFVDVRNGTLFIAGDVEAPVEVAIRNDFNNEPVNGVIASLNQGVFSSSDFTIRLDPGFLAVPGVEYQFLSNWSEISIGEIHLPDIGAYEWDISEIQDGRVSVVSSNEPLLCDFDESGRCDADDINRLLQTYASNTYEASLDLDSDGNVDLADRDLWLSLAGTSFGTTPFVTGDANLDGWVDASDLMYLGLNWQSQIGVSHWSNGDFNADGIVDSRDLNELGQSWVTGLSRLPENAESTAVPEPMSHLLVLLGLSSLIGLVRKRSSRPSSL